MFALTTFFHVKLVQCQAIRVHENFAVATNFQYRETACETVAILQGATYHFAVRGIDGLARSQTAPRVALGSERVLVVTEDLLAQLVTQARSESQ